jgi:peptidoglycan hydrolase CwlO-like protein
VSVLAALRRARIAAVAGGAGLLLCVAAPASAESTGDARARAAQLVARVQHVQAQLARAERAYDRSLAGVAASVNNAVEVDRASQRIAAAAQADQDALDGRIRGLYMSGGPLALYATLLQSGTVTDLQTGAVMVGRVVSSDQVVADADAAVAAQVAAQSRSADRQAGHAIATERTVAVVADRVQRLLQTQQALLDEANAQVAHLEAVDAARAALAAQAAAFGEITASRIASLRPMAADPHYMSLYHQAASTCPGLSWTVLASIGQVESGHGRNPSTSYAGAMGPMQFLPATFQAYGVDGNHDGSLDIMNPDDAIYTAARYLCANGAGAGGAAVAQAIWHYNHADWYVQMVLSLARQYAG